METEIKKFDPAAEYFFEEGCFITELSNSANDPAVSIARARLAPGETTRWHRLHGITERYVIQQGCGQVQIGALAPQKVLPGDVVLIPSSCRQRITSVGSDHLVFLAICTPRFLPEAYEDLETSSE
jgi:mannose-6-phosphate isomerase-like protein (cupin superfamily)